MIVKLMMMINYSFCFNSVGQLQTYQTTENMKLTDFGVALFWKNEKLKALLTSVGYRRIGTYLYFDNIVKNR